MEALVCELCGGNNLIKQEGFFVCQNCGTKYTVEEAKKLFGTVKIDRTEETEKLLVLARRARENNNSENAEKYYGLVLQEDPNNWEASFFQVYYQAMQCKIINISNAAISVANNIDTTLQLISAIPDDQEKVSALTCVCSYSQSIANILASSSVKHYKQYSSTNGAKDECTQRIKAIKSIYDKLEASIKNIFSDEKKILYNVQKAERAFITENVEYASLLDYLGELARLSNEMKETNPSKEDQSKKGCYVATAVYGSYDCPQVWTLRRYRDNTLAKTWYGRLFIYTYYAVSPTLVKWFGNTEWFKMMWKPKLDKMVADLNAQGVEDTPYSDRDW